MIKTLGITIVNASVTPRVVNVGDKIIITADVRENERGLSTCAGALVCTHDGKNIKMRMPPALITHAEKVIATHDNKIIRVRKEE